MSTPFGSPEWPSPRHPPSVCSPLGLTCTRASACSVLFNKLLTPHWVEAVGEEVAVSLNISHGGLRLRGELCCNERELEAWRGDHHHLT